MSTPTIACTVARIVGGAVVVMAVFYVLGGSPVRVDYAFISTNTGSRHEDSQWLLFLRTGDRYTESPIEAYLQKSGRTWQHNWVSYAGTGKNIFGKSVSWGHGRPGAVLDFMPYTFAHVESLPDAKKEEIWRELESGDQDNIQKRMSELQNAFFEAAVRNEK